MRPTELVPQFEEARHATAKMLRFGLALMTLGMFQKIVLADGFLGPAAELVYDGKKVPGLLNFWVATLAFSGQISTMPAPIKTPQWPASIDAILVKSIGQCILIALASEGGR
jgi:hypothetical protein